MVEEEKKRYIVYALYVYELVFFAVFASSAEMAKIKVLSRIAKNGWDKPERVGAKLIPPHELIAGADRDTASAPYHLWTMHSGSTAITNEVH